MLCENCHEQPASVFVTKSVDGEVSQYYLCARCAGEINSTVAFENLFKGFLNNILQPSTVIGKHFGASLKCTNCGMTYEQFQKIGKLGCAQCYDAFRAPLANVLRGVQNGVAHTGKIPSKSGGDLLRRREIKRLRGELQQAIAEEEYETAAVLRDQIRQAEAELAKGGEDA